MLGHDESLFVLHCFATLDVSPKPDARTERYTTQTTMMATVMNDKINISVSKLAERKCRIQMKVPEGNR